MGWSLYFCLPSTSTRTSGRRIRHWYRINNYTNPCLSCSWCHCKRPSGMKATAPDYLEEHWSWFRYPSYYKFILADYLSTVIHRAFVLLQQQYLSALCSFAVTTIVMKSTIRTTKNTMKIPGPANQSNKLLSTVDALLGIVIVLLHFKVEWVSTKIHR